MRFTGDICNAANATNGLLPHRACQLMIGPSGADKTTSLASEAAAGIGQHVPVPDPQFRPKFVMICAGISGTRRRMMEFSWRCMWPARRGFLWLLIAMDAKNLPAERSSDGCRIGKRPPLSIHGDPRSVKERRRDAGWRSAPFSWCRSREHRSSKSPDRHAHHQDSAKRGRTKVVVSDAASTMGRSQMRSAIPESSDPQNLLGSLSNIPDGFENRYTMSADYILAMPSGDGANEYNAGLMKF